MKKTVNLILNEKGGCGKSILMANFAYAKAKNDEILFVDADNSTNTSTRQLLFIPENRKEQLSLLNEKKVLIRDKFLSYLESLANVPFSEVYIDFGSPEAEQMVALIERDIPFEEFTNELGIIPHFHIPIAGGGAYAACIDYLKKILPLVQNKFQITIWKNITSFNNFEILAKELENNCKKLGLKLKQFGDFDPNTDLGNLILDGIRKGQALEDYSIGARYKLIHELKLNFDYGN